MNLAIEAFHRGSLIFKNTFGIALRIYFHDVLRHYFLLFRYNWLRDLEWNYEMFCASTVLKQQNI